jgi:hypothetical protein
MATRGTLRENTRVWARPHQHTLATRLPCASCRGTQRRAREVTPADRALERAAGWQQKRGLVRTMSREQSTGNKASAHGLRMMTGQLVACTDIQRVGGGGAGGLSQQAALVQSGMVCGRVFPHARVVFTWAPGPHGDTGNACMHMVPTSVTSS